LSDDNGVKIARVLYTTEQIQARVTELSQQISRDYERHDLHMVGVLENGFIFMADLVRQLTIPVVCQFVRPELKETVQQRTTTTEIFFGPEVDVRGKDVLLVEALVQSGITSEFLIRNFTTRGAASVKLCALLDKQAERRIHLQPEYYGFLCDESFVVGYGLGAPHHGRNLPYIGQLQR